MGNKIRKKTGGREKGTPNKKTAIIRVFCDYIVNYGLDKFKTELDKLEGQAYIDVILKLAKIFTNPKMSLMANKGLVDIFNQQIKDYGTNKQ